MHINKWNFYRTMAKTKQKNKIKHNKPQKLPSKLQFKMQFIYAHTLHVRIFNRFSPITDLIFQIKHKWYY